jgi:N-acylneuraminate cytidylyltransferase
MTKTAEVLAIIPARGGSKSIPHKNIQPFLGYPLIAFSIAAAQQAALVTRVIVSTDDEEIAEVAREFGAETPFVRPAEFAQDASTDFPVFSHALNWLKENEKYEAKQVVQLRPTSPLRPKGLIDEAINVINEHPSADSVRGLVPAGQNPHKMWRINEDGSMKNLLDVEGVREPYNAPRQSLPGIYWQTGHIDVIRTETILKKESMSGERVWPVYIDAAYSIDIDTFGDLDQAERYMSEVDLDVIWPGKAKRAFPKKVSLLLLDFDGVMTDDRVWVDETGREMVAANRGDGMGISLIKQAGVKVAVLSTETNPVVAARCKKLGIPVHQGLKDKAAVVKQVLKESNVDAAETIFVGNDVNDIDSFPLVGFAAVPKDAHRNARREADLQLKQFGGQGAVREVCDLILKLGAKER